MAEDVIQLASFRPNEPAFAAVLAFDSDEAEFVRGFEIGLLYGRLSGRPAEWHGQYHASNEVMVRRVAESSGYDVEVEPFAEGWIGADFVRRTQVNT